MVRLKGKFLFLMLMALVLSTSCEDNKQNIAVPRLTIQTFMAQAATSNIFQISFGNMAMQKGSSAEVKTFGAMLQIIPSTARN